MTQIIIFLISSTSAPKNSSKRSRALFSECGGMRGCSGTDEAGKEKKSQYTHYKKLDYTTVDNPIPTNDLEIDYSYVILFRKYIWRFYLELTF